MCQCMLFVTSYHIIRVPLSFSKGQRPLTSSITRVGCTAGLGELEQHVAAYSILDSTTHCKQNHVPLSFSKGQRPYVSMCRSGQGVSVSYSLTSHSLACCSTVHMCAWLRSLEV